MRSIFALIPISLAACGGTGENIDTEGCGLLDNGPYTEILAGLAMDETAPDVTEGGGAFTITLPGTATGYLAFDSPDDTEYAVFTSRGVDVAAFTPSGVEIPPSASADSSTVCATVMGRHIIELPVGVFYFALGPDSDEPFDFVLLHYDPD